ncbi:hypothetical protein HZA75_06040 [Candidatus Roizmanbacteria bacterium]|nr:hypothetical protein [Candidatus Roizmanbacteria bacterium]
MEILITILPAFLIFLFSIYKIVKDDYVFIRRNISLEQIFDISIIVFLVGLALVDFSLLGAVIAGIMVLYLITKYKKIPLGRIFDFFTFAFVIALPIGFLSHAFFIKGADVLVDVANAVLFLIFAFFSGKAVYPMIMSREVKEGSLHIIFLVFFAFVSFVDTVFLQQKGKLVLLNAQNILLALFFIFSFFLFFKQANSGFTNKKRV